MTVSPQPVAAPIPAPPAYVPPPVTEPAYVPPPVAAPTLPVAAPQPAEWLTDNRLLYEGIMGSIFR